MARRRGDTRRRRGRSNSSAGVILIVLVCAVFVLLGGTYVYKRQNHVAIHPETYCPVAGPKGVTVLLIDRTDSFNAIQRAALSAEFQSLIASLKKYERLDLYTISPDNPVVLQPEFSLCNPGQGSDLNPLIANPERAMRRWSEAFDKPLDHTLDAALEQTTASRSPILESIQSISITAYRDRLILGKPKRLIVVSDMLQHSDALSHYGQGANFTSFAASDRYRQVQTDLSGVDIEVLYIHRPTSRSRQGQSHVEFWQRFFHDQGGRLLRVKAVEG